MILKARNKVSWSSQELKIQQRSSFPCPAHQPFSLTSPLLCTYVYFSFFSSGPSYFFSFLIILASVKLWLVMVSTSASALWTFKFWRPTTAYRQCGLIQILGIKVLIGSVQGKSSPVVQSAVTQVFDKKGSRWPLGRELLQWEESCLSLHSAKNRSPPDVELILLSFEIQIIFKNHQGDYFKLHGKFIVIHLLYFNREFLPTAIFQLLAFSILFFDCLKHRHLFFSAMQ